MANAVIVHSLDLALYLLDTTTGKPISGNELQLFRDGKLLHPMEKEQGTLIFPNLGKNDFTLSISSKKFEPLSVQIIYAELDDKFPVLQLHLIPSKDNNYPFRCLSLEGILPGITTLTAVRADDSSCLIREFDSRKKLATLFNPHRLELNRTHYALVDITNKYYEYFKIVKKPNDQTIKIDRILETEVGSYSPITPIVFGRTDTDGSYCIRVRDEATNAKWLISYQIKGESYFQYVDFNKDREISHESQ